ncbi:MAG: hypothetical protein JXM70_05010 [Pirellulales bacterium]|nr:hypothetical protein [Pirellulales bacterium]
MSISWLFHMAFEQLAACFFAASLLLFLNGCGKQAPPRYDMSGKITHNNQPVPSGWIYFYPLSSEKIGKSDAGSKPGTTAKIIDGKYATFPGEGTVGGPHRVVINGLSGVLDPRNADELPSGSPLFPPITITMDIPKESTTHDFNLPTNLGAGR